MKTLEESILERLLFEASQLPQKFYHGSYSPLKIGSTIGGRKFKSHFGDAEKLLEAFRPEGMHSRLESVYLCSRTGDISLAGGSTDYVYLVEPLDEVQKHHIAWLGEIYNMAMLASDNLTKMGPRLNASLYKSLLPKAETAAMNYWMGKPPKSKTSEPWEYLCGSAKIVKQVKG